MFIHDIVYQIVQLNEGVKYFSPVSEAENGPENVTNVVSSYLINKRVAIDVQCYISGIV